MTVRATERRFAWTVFPHRLAFGLDYAVAAGWVAQDGVKAERVRGAAEAAHVLPGARPEVRAATILQGALDALDVTGERALDWRAQAWLQGALAAPVAAFTDPRRQRTVTIPPRLPGEVDAAYRRRGRAALHAELDATIALRRRGRHQATAEAAAAPPSAAAVAAALGRGTPLGPDVAEAAARAMATVFIGQVGGGPGPAGPIAWFHMHRVGGMTLTAIAAAAFALDQDSGNEGEADLHPERTSQVGRGTDTAADWLGVRREPRPRGRPPKIRTGSL